MTEGTKPTPRVLRRETSTTPRVIADEEVNSQIFTAQLNNGRIVTMREMTAGDLLFMEKSLSNVGDMERSLKLAARISCGEGRVSYEDLQKLTMRDLKLVTTLLGEAGATDDDEDEDEFPNE
tara:strand:+ start:836 stop:1201 length:366 start_codon:yes stop_codon:yes gene_type:complete